jgi:hypothetical protein
MMVTTRSATDGLDGKGLVVVIDPKKDHVAVSFKRAQIVFAIGSLATKVIIRRDGGQVLTGGCLLLNDERKFQTLAKVLIFRAIKVAIQISTVFVEPHRLWLLVGRCPSPVPGTAGERS